MKKLCLLFLFCAATRGHTQNEFAATAFYQEFKKIAADAQTGFSACKGTKRKAEYAELAEEFRAKLMLPLADSGKVVVPKEGNPYVIYYFEPDKVRLKVDQRGLNLRDAISTAWGQPLYTRAETSIVNNYPFTSMLYFSKPDESGFKEALFRQLVYYREGKYFLSLEIRGKAAEQ